jgi:hypothetical protein
VVWTFAICALIVSLAVFSSLPQPVAMTATATTKNQRMRRLSHRRVTAP